MALTKIALNKLKIGHYVCLPLGWHSHPFMRNNFKIQTPEELAVLKTLGLENIKIDPSKSETASSEAPLPAVEHTAKDHSARATQTAAETKEHQLHTFHRSEQRKAEGCFDRSISEYKDLFAQFNADPSAVYGLLTAVVTQVSTPLFGSSLLQPVYLILNDSDSDAVFTHSMSVMGLTLMMAHSLNYSQANAELLALAALVADIGMLRVPHQIRSKKTPLEKSEQNFLAAHVGYSLDQLRKTKSIPDAVLALIASHHERRDGSGYPKGLTQGNYPKAAEIIQVADYYDWLINPLPSQQPLPPQLAIALLLKHAPTQFNPVMVEALANSLGIYPPGTIVELSDGQIAIVAASHPGDKLHPWIKRFHNGRFIGDLMFEDLSTLGLSISRSIPYNQLDDKILNVIVGMRFSYFLPF